MTSPPPTIWRHLNKLTSVTVLLLLVGISYLLVESCSFVGAGERAVINELDNATGVVWTGTLRHTGDEEGRVGQVDTVEIFLAAFSDVLEEPHVEKGDDQTVVTLSARQPAFGNFLDFTGVDLIPSQRALAITYVNGSVERCFISVTFRDSNNQRPTFNNNTPREYSLKKRSWDSSIALNWNEAIQITDYDHLPEHAKVQILSSDADIISGNLTNITNMTIYPNRFIFDVQLFAKQVVNGTYELTATDGTWEDKISVEIVALRENLFKPRIRASTYYFELDKDNMPGAGERVDVEIEAEDEDEDKLILEFQVEGKTVDYLDVDSENKLVFTKDSSQLGLEGKRVEVLVTAREVDTEDKSSDSMTLTLQFPRFQFSAANYYDVIGDWEGAKQGEPIAQDGLGGIPELVILELGDDAPGFVSLADNEQGLVFNTDVTEETGEVGRDRNRVVVFTVRAVSTEDAEVMSVATVVLAFPLHNSLISTTEALPDSSTTPFDCSQCFTTEGTTGPTSTEGTEKTTTQCDCPSTPDPDPSTCPTPEPPTCPPEGGTSTPCEGPDCSSTETPTTPYTGDPTTPTECACPSTPDPSTCPTPEPPTCPPSPPDCGSSTTSDPESSSTDPPEGSSTTESSPPNCPPGCTTPPTPCPDPPPCPTTTPDPNCPEVPTCSPVSPEPCECEGASTCEPCDNEGGDESTCPPCEDDCSTGGLIAATVTASVLMVTSLCTAGYFFWVLRKAAINPFNLGQNAFSAPTGVEDKIASSFKSPPPPSNPPPPSKAPPSEPTANGTLGRKFSFGEGPEPAMDTTPTSAPAAVEPGFSNPAFTPDEPVAAPAPAPTAAVDPAPTAVPAAPPSVTSTTSSATPKKSNIKPPREIEPDYEEMPGTKSAKAPPSRKISRVVFSPEDEYISIDGDEPGKSTKEVKRREVESDSDYEYERL